MCGICGVIVPHGAATTGEPGELARNMASRLTHRGPDDLGVWEDVLPSVALGHTRLAIIDLSPAGAQPMVSRNGRFVICYNGEIYNHGELRHELEKTGVSFRGHSDTEVLLEACAKWGLEAVLPRVSGMFAVALWDSGRKILSLARDRFGKKPLYYGWAGPRFVFASELKAVHELPGFTAEVDPDAARLYGLLGYVPGTDSIFQGIRKLAAGSWAELDFANSKGRLPEPRRYWSSAAAILSGVDARPATTTDEAVEAIHSALSAAVRSRMVADVPLGALLSGGIDSSLVVSLMQAYSDRRIRTFSVGFADEQYDESPFARSVAKHLGTEHTEIVVEPREAMDVIPKLPAIYDEPFSDSSQIPTYLISSVARRSVTVALSGDGGDEVFGGYNRYLAGMRMWRALGFVPGALRTLSSRALLNIPPSLPDLAFGAVSGILPRSLRHRRPADLLHKLARVLPSEDIGTFYAGVIALGSRFEDAAMKRRLLETLPELRALDALADADWLMAADTLRYLPDDILTKVDRASMAVSLEVRNPFLDHAVFEAAWRLPRDAKIRDGVGKWCLRQILSRYVPPALFERPKAGFGIPLASWLRGPLRDWAENLLGDDRLSDTNAAELLGYTFGETIGAIWQQHVSGRRNREHELWSILMYQAWHEAWVA